MNKEKCYKPDCNCSCHHEPVANESSEMKNIYTIEEKDLDKENVDSLKRIMNFYYRPKIDEPELPKCFEPRNAILFLDKKGKIIACIELCLSCAGWRIYTQSKMKYIGSFENLFCWCQKGMSDFFKQNGIHYGIDYFKL